jgi:beta-glucosidase
LIDMQAIYGDALPPIIVSENGASFPEPDSLAPGEVILDTNRIDYLNGHVLAVADAIAAGVPVEEYTVWSLIDNFEWSDGFSQRFGITHVDMETGRRTPKASYEWYRSLIESSRA